MSLKHNINVLPFYTDLRYQDYKREFNFGAIYKLYSPSARLLPFQIIRTHRSSTPITSVTLQKIKPNGALDGAAVDITAQVSGSGLNILEFSADGYDIIKYPGALIFPSYSIGLGQYYITITDGTETWYSEIFTTVNDSSKLIRLVYSSIDNITVPGGHIDYTAPFAFECYIDSKLGKPRYPFEEEVKKRDGFTFPEKQISEKRYVFEFVAPEYLLDALRLVRLNDVVRIVSEGVTYEVETIFIESRWQDQGNLAIVTVEFGISSIVKKTGGGYALDGGDFMDDFNDDYFQ